jgi:hypothetical protein
MSWYRPGGSKGLDNMHFLVLSDLQYELLIGEASIIEHNMLPSSMLTISSGKEFHNYYNPETGT